MNNQSTKVKYSVRKLSKIYIQEIDVLSMDWIKKALIIEGLSLIVTIGFLLLQSKDIYLQIPLIVFVLFVPYGTTSIIIAKLISTTKNIYINSTIIVMVVVHVFLVSLGITLFSGL